MYRMKSSPQPLWHSDIARHENPVISRPTSETYHFFLVFFVCGSKQTRSLFVLLHNPCLSCAGLTFEISFMLVLLNLSTGWSKNPSAWISEGKRWVLKQICLNQWSYLPRIDGAGNQAAPTMARSMSLSLKEVKARCIFGGQFLVGFPEVSVGRTGVGLLDVGCCCRLSSTLWPW